MSGLETLPPDQRAVLQLILTQGRGYAELAGLLKIDPAAVRTRAHAGLAALAPDPGAGLSEPERARIADYLLGEQDEGERIVTLAQLGESAAASRWARALRDRLAPLARTPLPDVPAAAANGTPPYREPELVRPQPLVPPAAEPMSELLRPQPLVPPAAEPVPELLRPEPLLPPASAPVAPPPPFRRRSRAAFSAGPGATARAARPPAQPSRRGGAILLGAIALVAAIVVVILVAGGGGDDSPPAASRPTTSTPARSTPARTSTTGAQTAGRVVAQVNLLPTDAGGQALAVGLVQQQGSKRTIALRAQALPANGAQDIYAAWLQGAAGTKLLGFVPTQVKANGTFTVSAPLPPNAADYDTVLVTRESITTTPTQPGEAILSGALKLS